MQIRGGSSMQIRGGSSMQIRGGSSMQTLRRRVSIGFDRGLVIASLAGFASLGCNIRLFEENLPSATANVCESNGDCAGGICKAGLCQAKETNLPAVFLEVTPPALDSKIAGITFTTLVEEFSPNPDDAEIKLGYVSAVTGTVRSPLLSESTCLPWMESAEGLPAMAEDRSLPARVTLTPRARLLGLSSQPVTAYVDAPIFSAQQPPARFQVNLNAPPGRYDIYVEPKPVSDGCVRPPFLVLDQEIAAGDVTLNIELPQPELLGVTVRYPNAIDALQSWTLDIIERTSGRVLSSRARLGEPTATETGLEYSVNLAFSETVGADGKRGSELVRLSPPRDVDAPVIYVERSVVDLFQDGTGLIEQLTVLPTPVVVGGRMTVDNGPAAVPGRLTFVATDLFPTSPGTLASFSRTVETDEEGWFQVTLLPSMYTVIAEPVDNGKARTVVGINVQAGAETQLGKTIQISDRKKVTGRVVSFDRSPVTGAPIWAGPAYEDGNVLKTVLGEVSLSPSALGLATDEVGYFELLADPGTFHLAARPDSSTGFAWRVLLDQEIQDDRHIDEIRLPLPLVVQGTLTSQDTGGRVPNAFIRMYALIKDGSPVSTLEEADQAIAIGESRADPQGEFRLLLPGSL